MMARLAVLLACAACASWAWPAAVAAEAPARAKGSQHARAAHPRRCARRSRSHGHRAKRSARCRRARHKQHTQAPAALAPATTTGGALAPAGAPGASVPGGSAPVAPVLTPTLAPESPQGGGPPSVPHVEVTAVEYSFTLSRTTVPAGKVILQFVNHGQDEHNLNAAPGEGEPVGSIPDTRSGEVRQQEVEMRAGTYTLFCSLAEHERKGMKATLVVE